MAFDKKTVMSVFIAVIMIVSVIGFSLTFATPAQKLTYNDFTFLQTAQGWQTKINTMRVIFSNYPAQLEYIPFDEGAKTALDARALWFSYDPNDLNAPAIADIFFYMEEVLATVSDIYVQRGLVNNTEYVLPEATCMNATVTVPVLLFRSGNETAITHEQGCIIATAESDQELYRLGDRLLYQALGVMRS